MSDHWEFYPCEMGEHRAFIFYDHGIRTAIDTYPHATLIKVRLAIREPTPQGLPTNEEFPQLSALEDQLSAEVTKSGGLYVGRVTVAGYRYFHFFAPLSREDAAALAARVGEAFGYELRVVVKEDPKRSGYWDDLFPSDRDWQVLQDLKVIESLDGHGDNNEVPRRIDHWAYFPTPEARNAFETWSVEKGFEVQSRLEPDDAKAAYGLQVFHTARPRLDEISIHTLGLMEQAKKLGGDYDGWESSVERGDA